MGREQENIILAKYGLFIGHSQATTSGITWHTTRASPVPVHSLPTPAGWQTSAPAEPPLASETGDAQGLVIDTALTRLEKANSLTSSKGQKLEAWQNYFEISKIFHKLWNLSVWALGDGKCGKAISFTH